MRRVNGLMGYLRLACVILSGEPRGGVECPKCQGHLFAEDFPRDHKRASGRFPYCRVCNSIRSCEWHMARRKLGPVVRSERRNYAAKSRIDALRAAVRRGQVVTSVRTRRRERPEGWRA
mgnify:CR=1 FL=1